MTKNKIPHITLLFWIMKICATTLGETGGDLISMTLNVGYAISSLALISAFFLTLVGQLKTDRYIPIIYWLVIVSTSTAGTTMSDFMDRTLGLDYVAGTSILLVMFLSVLYLWYKSGRSLSVSQIHSFKGELFYWGAILVSNTLGTALGDFLADSSGLGFEGGAILISSLIAIVILFYYFAKISHVVLFWIAFVLTRPFGATFGDLLTKDPDKGGLGFGTKGSSLILFSILAILIIYETVKTTKHRVKHGLHHQRHRGASPAPPPQG
jgi:uncharacterized membrane-anchored protein